MIRDFEDIRPYNDSEVNEVLQRLVNDHELQDTLTGMKFPRLTKWLPWVLRPLARKKLAGALEDVHTIADFQQVIAKSWRKSLDKTTSEITVSGLSELDPTKHYLYICNHRDIAMDPAVVGLSLDRAGRETMRIAIGDNLLTKPFTSDLMRLNKSFIVKRSVTGRREKLNALMQLSSYIRFSINEDNSSVWIAQREGRAKDGLDRTDTALIKMLMLSKKKEQKFAESAAELNIVPVSISYELDPCDEAKARELYYKQVEGSYQKKEHEDIESIYQGIVGDKGHVHVAFGQPLVPEELESADTIAEAIDQHIIENYHQHPTNLVAYELLHGECEELEQLKEQYNISLAEWEEATSNFLTRMSHIPEDYRDMAIASYANPVSSLLELGHRAE